MVKILNFVFFFDCDRINNNCTVVVGSWIELILQVASWWIELILQVLQVALFFANVMSDAVNVSKDCRKKYKPSNLSYELRTRIRTRTQSTSPYTRREDTEDVCGEVLNFPNAERTRTRRRNLLTIVPAAFP